MTSKLFDTPLAEDCLNNDSDFLVNPTTGAALSFTDAFASSDEISSAYPDGLLLIAIKGRLAFSLTYLAALRSKTPVLIVDPDINPSQLMELSHRFQPKAIVSDSEFHPESWEHVGSAYGATIYYNPDKNFYEINPNLATLMPTSGSTGAPKCVRVSFGNLLASTSSIGKYLGLDPSRRLITSLPLHYTYGLSLLHLALGFRIPLVLSESSVISREFWEEFTMYAVTDFSGVPFQYELLLRAGIPESALRQIKCMTQAGGRLAPSKTLHFLELADKYKFNYFTMYGQTEATPRISFVPPGSALSKLGSAGVAIPGGQLSIDITSSNSSEDGYKIGEVVYSGPNVCLGYASDFTELSLGDQFKGTLRTGDLGYLDEDGFLFLSGRSGREVKVSGKRVNLESLESMLEPLTKEVVVLGAEDKIVVIASGTDEKSIRVTLREKVAVHPSKISIYIVQEIPRLTNGKIDYQSLVRKHLGV